MSVFAHLALLGWLPVAMVLFALLPTRRAAMVTVIAAWLFLPVAGYQVPGLPDYTKMTAACLGVFLGAAAFDVDRLLGFRPRWYDLPMAVWCLAPLAASVSNDLGWYDGVSASMQKAVVWGLPYLVGRVYFADAQGMRELAMGMVIGALVYVPLCLWEVRMSPQLHRQIYGFATAGFHQNMRYGGYRPVVFMPNGLEVAQWLMGGLLVGAWMWLRGSWRSLWGLPAPAWLALLLATLVLTKTLNVVVMLAIGFGLLYATKLTRSKWALVLVIVGVIGYVSLRSTGTWSARGLVTWAEKISPDRAQSLEFRLDNEDALAARAMQRPVFGWGGWGRARVHDEYGKDLSITDGLWIIALGTTGLVGLVALVSMFAVPVLLTARRLPPRVWSSSAAAAATALAVLVLLALVNNLPNASENPIITITIGGLSGMSFATRRVARRAAAGESQPVVGIKRGGGLLRSHPG